MLKNKETILQISTIFTRLLYKSNFSLTNKSGSILGLDLLRDCVKRDLIIIICSNLEKKIVSLLGSQSDFPRSKIVRNIFLTLICQILEAFLAKYYGRPVKISKKTVNKYLCNRLAIEDIQILFQIPIYSLIDSECKLFCSTFAPIYNIATDAFLESLFENLVIEISNCVLFIIISEFSDVYDIRQNLYKANFLSVRTLERFKNNFIWQTTINATIERPKNIYNSRYTLWVIRTTGIYCKVIYANRSNDLDYLRKIPLATVTFIEFLDFSYSRLDEVFYTIGNTIRYGLTSIVGQTVGLIWRGIIEGLKN